MLIGNALYKKTKMKEEKYYFKKKNKRKIKVKVSTNQTNNPLTFDKWILH